MPLFNFSINSQSFKSASHFHCCLACIFDCITPSSSTTSDLTTLQFTFLHIFQSQYNPLSGTSCLGLNVCLLYVLGWVNKLHQNVHDSTNLHRELPAQHDFCVCAKYFSPTFLQHKMESLVHKLDIDMLLKPHFFRIPVVCWTLVPMEFFLILWYNLKLDWVTFQILSKKLCCRKWLIADRILISRLSSVTPSKI